MKTKKSYKKAEKSSRPYNTFRTSYRLTKNNTKKKTNQKLNKSLSGKTSSNKSLLGKTSSNKSLPKKTSSQTLLKRQTKHTLQQMLVSKDKNLVSVLQKVCTDSGNCLALGNYYNTAIANLFNHFKELKDIKDQDIRKIGETSFNGFVFEVPFEKQGYTAYTVLKCSQKKDSDNLMYEYYVGKNFINKYIHIYPCFVETYDLFIVNTKADWNTLSTYKNDSKKDIILHNMITPQEINWDKSCEISKRLCVLIQHFNDFKTLATYCRNNFDEIKYDLPNIMYQVYFVLQQLGEKFTHYDLHTSNVCLYKPYKGNKYIMMHYHLSNGRIISFKTEYISKIIDYGRCYFNDGKTNTSDLLRTKICPSSYCFPDCGATKGYKIIQGNVIDKNVDFYNIMPNKPNLSIDLLPLYRLDGFFNKNDGIDLYENLVFKTMYGTPYLKRSDFGKSFSINGKKSILRIVQNIDDAVKAFEARLDSWNTEKLYKKYTTSWTKMADMHVYSDGRNYEFIVAPLS